MSTPIAILLGIIVLALLGFIIWYLSTESAREAAHRKVTAGEHFGAAADNLLQGVFSFVS